MLSVTKNKSKSSMATVKFFTTRRVVPRQVPIVIPRPIIIPQQIPNNGGVQKNLTEVTFRRYLTGYQEILPMNLPMIIGKRIRYAIDTFDSARRIIKTDYRLGGVVRFVSPDLSYATLFNPVLNKSWNLNIRQPAGKRLRIYCKY